MLAIELERNIAHLLPLHATGQITSTLALLPAEAEAATLLCPVKQRQGRHSRCKVFPRPLSGKEGTNTNQLHPCRLPPPNAFGTATAGHRCPRDRTATAATAHVIRTTPGKKIKRTTLQVNHPVRLALSGGRGSTRAPINILPILHSTNAFGSRILRFLKSSSRSNSSHLSPTRDKLPTPIVAAPIQLGSRSNSATPLVKYVCGNYRPH